MRAAVATRSRLPAMCGIERRAALRAEQRLLLAVLEEAVRTFQRYVHSGSPRGRRLFGEVEAWFGSDDTTWTFSFVPLCDALGFDPAYLRVGVQRWRDARRPSIQPVNRSPRRPPNDATSRRPPRLLIDARSADT